MFGSFGWMELLLILIIVLIIFGAGKLPQLGEGVGKAIKGFKKSVHEADAPVEDASSPAETPSHQSSSIAAQVPPTAPAADGAQAEPRESMPRQG